MSKFITDAELFGSAEQEGITEPSFDGSGPQRKFVNDDVLFDPKEIQRAEKGKWRQPSDYVQAKLQKHYEPLVRAAADEEGVDEDLLVALVWQESRFDPGATSHAGAAGLGQVMPKTAKYLGYSEEEMYDPNKAVKASAKYLKTMLKMFNGDLDKALAAYNAGPGTVRKHGGVPKWDETQKYVRNIRGKYDELRGRK